MEAPPPSPESVRGERAAGVELSGEGGLRPGAREKEVGRLGASLPGNATKGVMPSDRNTSNVVAPGPPASAKEGEEGAEGAEEEGAEE